MREKAPVVRGSENLTGNAEASIQPEAGAKNKISDERTDGAALLSRLRDDASAATSSLSHRDVQAEINNILATFKAHSSVSVKPISSLDALPVKDQQDVAKQGGTESNTKGVAQHDGSIAILANILLAL